MFPVFCPSGWLWSVSSATCIKLINDKMSWQAARNECRSMGADLMKILDSKTNEFVTSKATFYVLNEMFYTSLLLTENETGMKKNWD